MGHPTKNPESDDSQKHDSPEAHDSQELSDGLASSARLSAESWTKRPADQAGAATTVVKEPRGDASQAEKGKPFAGNGDSALRDSLEKLAGLSGRDSADPGQLRRFAHCLLRN